MIQGTGSAVSQGWGKGSAEQKWEGRVGECFNLTPEKVRVWNPDSENRSGEEQQEVWVWGSEKEAGS